MVVSKVGGNSSGGGSSGGSGGGSRGGSGHSGGFFLGGDLQWNQPHEAHPQNTDRPEAK